MKSVDKVLRVFNKAIKELSAVEEENMSLSTKRFNQADLLIAEGKDLAEEAKRAASVRMKLESIITQ
jgi:hypothetical protein